jgi:phage-related protein
MRSFSALIQAAVSVLQSPKFALLVQFHGLGLYVTNHRSAISYGGQSYDPASVILAGASENYVAEAPAAALTIQDLDGAWRGRFHLDSLRDEVVTLRILYDSSGTWTDTTWSMTIACDSDSADDKQVILRLASIDSVEGTEVPRRTTQEAGCQHDFQGPLCPFVWRSGMSAALKECDKSYDGPLGCKAHFPDVTEAGFTFVIPKPFGGFLGGISHRLVLRG